MPFKSEAQRRFMYAKHPDIAAEFQAATPKGKKLPAKVSDHDLKKSERKMSKAERRKKK